MNTSPTPPANAFTTWPLPGPLNALAWSQATDAPPTCAIASGTGTLFLLRQSMAQPLALPLAAEGALLALVSTPHGFVTATDTGQLHLTTPQGETTLLATLPTPFTEHLAYSAHADLLLAASGRTLTALSLPHGEVKFTSQLASSIGGLAASPIGRRVAASHYNGTTILDLAAPKNPPRTLEWKGSHLALTYSVDGKWLISAMQEQAIHLWRLSDGLDLQMRGYPGPISQFSWSHDGQLLATNGGSGVPLWSFKDKLKGPAGTQAQVVADSGTGGMLVTSVAMHPKGPFAAVGYTDGLALLANTQSNQSILLKAPPTPNTQHPTPITHLAWSPDGLLLTLADESGHLTLTDFSQLASA